MKKSLFIICLSASMSMPLAAGQKVLLVTGEWAPYTSEKMQGYGFVTEIITAAFKEAGLEPQYQFFTWVRCEALVKNGSRYAAFPYFITDQRKKDFDFSDELTTAKGRFFYLKKRIKSDITWEKYEDLKPYKIGGTSGYWYEKVFKNAGLNVDYASSDELGIRKLYVGRFDLLASEELVGWYLINKLFPDEVNKFDIVKKPMNSDSLRLMVSRTYPDAASITEKVNAALGKIKEKGIYSAILKKYNISE